MRIIFMGTPDFSVPTLKSLVEAGHEVAAVVTQPDKPKGRGKAVQMTPVKEQALEYGIPVYQPLKVRDPAFVETVRQLAADVIVVVAFGQIIPKSILDMPKYGCVNIHASLLPKYRGAAPIQWAVIDGERESGITTMMMAEGLDTGDMLEKTVVVLDEKETGGSLHDKLSLAGREADPVHFTETGRWRHHPHASDRGGHLLCQTPDQGAGGCGLERPRSFHRAADPGTEPLAQRLHLLERKDR